MTWLFGYDPEGNLTSITDPNGNLTVNGYDRLQRQTIITRPKPVPVATNPIITLDYDGRDSVTSVRDPRDLTTTYARDGLANTRGQSSPDSGASNATYDAAGNLLTRTDARGKTTTYTYDPLNRVKTISYQTGVGSVFQYDGGKAPYQGSIGRLTRLTDESGVTTFGYDKLGRLISRNQLMNAKTLSIRYAWGSDGPATGKVTSITYPSGARVNYAYDAAGRLGAITANPPGPSGTGPDISLTVTILSAITYNADNNLLAWNWANGVAYWRSYDSFGRLLSYPLGNPQGTGNASGLLRTLAYDDGGRITGYTHSNSGGSQTAFDQSFSYDGLDRLVQHGTFANLRGYSYDANGNRTGQSLDTANYVNTVSPTSNRLTQVQTAGKGVVPINTPQSYTDSGSLTADGVATYTYSDRGRMSTSTRAGQVTSYTYNGLEQRVAKSGTLVPTGAAYYAYDKDGKTLGEYDANLNPVAETVYLGSTPVAVLKVINSPKSLAVSMKVGDVYADQIDTPRVITRNSDEAILWRWDSGEAFGDSLPQDNPSGLGTYTYNQRMPGQVYDLETRSLYNWNRDYQARTGRYAQSDPIGLKGGINTYAYGNEDPITSVDPSGLVGWSGTYHARTLIEVVGAGWVDFELTSDCVDGKRFKGKVRGIGPGAGVGIRGIKIIVGETYGKVKLKDPYDEINPNNLAGIFTWASAGVAVGTFDISAGRVVVGRAQGWNPEHGSGLDIGANAIFGSSTLLDGAWEQCACGVKGF